MAKMKVIGGNLNVRKEPNINSEVIHVLADGEIIKPAPENNGWCAWGSGYVMARWLEPAPESAEKEQTSEARDMKEVAKEITEAAKEIKSAAKTVKKASAKKTTAEKK